MREVCSGLVPTVTLTSLDNRFFGFDFFFLGDFRGETFAGEIETLDGAGNVIIFVSDMNGET